jgi:FtsZ-interacting cell division protein ZipA
MFKEMTTKKKIMIAIIVIVIVAAIIIIWRRNKKKKEATLLASNSSNNSNSNYQPPTETERPAERPNRVIPKEDLPHETTEAPLSVVKDVVPENRPEPQPKNNQNRPATGAPGTLGVPGNGAPGANAGAKKPATPGSSLPPEFMTNANDPNAGQ